MNKTIVASALLALAASASSAKEIWRDPGVTQRNRLPARAIVVPCESAKTALAMNFVKAHNGSWNHADWLNFLRELEEKGYFPIDTDRVGLILEDKKAIFFSK